MKLRIGTRGSRLALWQAAWVRTRLHENPDVTVTIHPIRTSGDKILDVPLAKIGGKGLFVKEIEEALLRGDIDLAVHSMKDVPTTLPDGLGILAMTEREDPRDVVSSRTPMQSIDDLPHSARIGTSSLRRQAQLLHRRPDLAMTILRGNLDTRLRKLQEGGLDAIVVAAAGVKRLGFASNITAYLPIEVSLPAMGQGVLGIEGRRDDVPVRQCVAHLNHQPTAWAVTAERAFLSRLQGGCQVPIGAYAVIVDGQVRLDGFVASVDGRRLVRDHMEGPIEQAETLGTRLAERLLNHGADPILQEIYQSAE